MDFEFDRYRDFDVAFQVGFDCDFDFDFDLDFQLSSHAPGDM